MNCFDLHYYQLNRKLLILVGQWPYQRYRDRVIAWVLYASLMISGVYYQVQRELYVDAGMELWVEHITEGLSSTVISFRYYTFTIYNKKIKQLLDEMNEHWQSLIHPSDQEIFSASLTESIRYVHSYVYLCLGILVVFCVTVISTPALKYVPYINDSCIILTMYPSGDIFDPETQCYIVLIYMCAVVIFLTMVVVATDTMYVLIMLHAVSLFKVACHRIEHAFDDCSDDEKYTSGKSLVYQRILSAVHCHRTAIRFAEDLGDTYSLPNMISVSFNMICIAISLYWAAVSQGQKFKMIISVLVSMVFMVHLFFMDFPSQTLLDNSEEIISKAYSSLWYKASPKEQALVLMAMQRGLRPTAIIIGKIHRATLESFAAEVQASFSYFTLMLSMQ